VPIRLFLEHDHSFGPEDIAKLSAAFEAALGKLGLVDRTDPKAAEVAKLIIEFAKQGERDPERLCALKSGVSRGHDGGIRKKGGGRNNRKRSMRNLWCVHCVFRMEPSTSDSLLVRPLRVPRPRPSFPVRAGFLVCVNDEPQRHSLMEKDYLALKRVLIWSRASHRPHP